MGYAKTDRLGWGWVVLRGGMAVAVLGYTWAAMAPESFAASVAAAVPVAKWAGAGGLAGGWWWWNRRGPRGQTWEDVCTGLYVTGLPGSGKTGFAYLEVLRFCGCGWGWIWLSIKSSLPLLAYLPAQATGRCILFAPYSEHPAGLNLMRCYTGTSTERELVADQVAELFERLHGAMSGNMRELIRMGTLALLIWAAAHDLEPTLWELYRLFMEEGLREQVLSEAPRPIRDAFAADEARKSTMQAVRAQLRRAVASESLLAALSQTGPNAIDLWAVMDQERWLVCDTPEAQLGPAVASFLCRVIASRVQLLTSRRQPGSRPFGCFADEFQEYSSPSFAKGIATGREFGLAWVLIHQSRANQGIGAEVAGAVHLTGNRVYFQQAPEDVRAAVEATEGRFSPESFTHLAKRHYRALRRIQGQPRVQEGITADLPEADPAVAEAIQARAAAGPQRGQILRAIQQRRLERRAAQP